jgi:hypothetical protein
MGIVPQYRLAGKYPHHLQGYGYRSFAREDLKGDTAIVEGV